MLKVEQEFCTLLQMPGHQHAAFAAPGEFEQDFYESDQSITAIEAELHRRAPHIYPPAHPPREIIKPMYYVPHMGSIQHQIVQVLRIIIIVWMGMVFLIPILRLIYGH